MATWDIDWSSPLYAAAAGVTQGYVVCPSPDESAYVIATLAARNAIGRVSGIAITANITPGSIAIQYSGEVSNELTQLGAGAVAAVRVGDDGRLQRVTTTPPAPGDVIMGDCDANGAMTLSDVSSVNPFIGSGLAFQEEGTPVLTATIVNFVGPGATVTNVGGVATVTIPGGDTAFQEEGTPVVTSPTLNFVGAGVTLTNVGGVATATIPITGLAVQDEGTPVITGATALNFTGTGVTASNVAGVATVTVPGTTIPTSAGDWTGLITANVVERAHGATVPIAGALTTGNVLQVSGASALSYAPVNLAGGANFVTGTLPSGNLPTSAGDWTGLITANVVERVHGATVPIAGALTTGNSLRVTGVSALGYSALNLAGGSGFVSGVLPVANLPSLAGDVTGAINASDVVALTGSAGSVDVKAATLASSSSAGLTITTPALNARPIVLQAGSPGLGFSGNGVTSIAGNGSVGGTIASIAGNGSVAGGPITLQAGQGTSGAGGNITATTGVGDTSGSFVLQIADGTTSAGIVQITGGAASVSNSDVIITAGGANAINGGNTTVSSGSSTTTNGGTLNLNSGDGGAGSGGIIFIATGGGAVAAGGIGITTADVTGGADSADITLGAGSTDVGLGGLLEVKGSTDPGGNGSVVITGFNDPSAAAVVTTNKGFSVVAGPSTTAGGAVGIAAGSASGAGTAGSTTLEGGDAAGGTGGKIVVAGATAGGNGNVIITGHDSGGSAILRVEDKFIINAPVTGNPSAFVPQPFSVHGRFAVSMGNDPSDGDQTVSGPNSVNTLFVVTGDCSVDRTLTITCSPDDGGWKFIHNQISGAADNLLVKFSSGAAATIPAGSNAVVYSDGTNAQAMII